MLDEALDILTQLWSGREVNHIGPHYRAEHARFLKPGQNLIRPLATKDHGSGHFHPRESGTRRS